MTYKTPPDDPVTETWHPDLPPETGGPRARPHDGGKPVIDSWKYDKADLSQSVTVKREQGKGTRPWREPAGVEGPFLPLDHDVLDVHSPVVITEGERDRDAVLASGARYPVTCWISGAQNWAQTDWSILAESRIILWPDRDEAGRSAMEELADHLFELGADIWAADIPEGPDDGTGAADYSGEKIKAILDGAYQMENPAAATVVEGALPEKSKCFPAWQPMDGMMETGAVALWHGAPKSGKSAFGLLAAAQLLSGTKIAGFPLSSAPRPEQDREHELLMVWIEEQQSTSDMRRWAISDHHQIDPEIWRRSHWIYRLDQASTDNRLVAIEIAAKRIKPSVIFIDNLARLAPTAESDSEKATTLITDLERIAQAVNAAIVIIHHDRKMPGQDGGKASGDEMIRGSSGLAGAVRVIAQIKTEGKGITVSGGGTNNAASAGRRFFERLGQDVNGFSTIVLHEGEMPSAFKDVTKADALAAWLAVGNANAEDRRSDIRAKENWAGHLVAEALGKDAGRGKAGGDLTADQGAAREQAKGMLVAWVQNENLKVVPCDFWDEKSRKNKSQNVYEFGPETLHDE